MLNLFQAAFLGLLQGFTELFPISSLGHSVILPSIFGWNIRQDDPYFITFLVATHLATAIVLVGFFWRDWLHIITGVMRSLRDREIKRGDTYARMGWLLVVATVPAGLLGLLFQESLQKLFASAQIAAGFLLVNGLILLGAERLRKRKDGKHNDAQSDANVAKLSWKAAIGVGLAQAGALIPGISRSGSSMAGGLIAGLDNVDAARFSFLLSTPIIAAAAVLKLPELFQPAERSAIGAVIVGALCAAVAAYLAVKFLLKYFETRTLNAYGIYCVLAGIIFSIVLLVR